MLVCAWASLSMANSPGPLRHRDGLRNSAGRHRLSSKQPEALVEALQEKVGLLDLRFDETGFLTVGDRTRVEGSPAAARALLLAAMDGAQAIYLENPNRFRRVTFALAFFGYPLQLPDQG